MPYLVASRRTSRMGLVPILANGAATARSNLIASRFTNGGGGPVLPGPMPVLAPTAPIGGGGGQLIVRGPFTYTPPNTPAPILPSPLPGPMPVYGGGGGSVGPIVVGPISTAPPAANASTPVPAGYPTSQIFVDANGGFWEYSSSQNQWMNVGTPYNTGAPYVPPAVPTGSTPSAPTSLISPTTAPAPVTTVSITPSSTYSDILNWLQEDTLGATIGFPSIPNWIFVAAGGALAWKFSHSGGTRSRNPLRKRRRPARTYGRR